MKDTTLQYYSNSPILLPVLVGELKTTTENILLKYTPETNNIYI